MSMNISWEWLEELARQAEEHLESLPETSQPTWYRLFKGRLNQNGI